ncbi:hypothetical protein [Streptomyces niveus]|uniref:hypothetical protein n=1 Tax=Streptomyces niveus TaxID=193462 RepID=UPI0036B89D84
MRDAIARTLVRVLSVLIPRGPGRHSAGHLTRQTMKPTEPRPVSPWGKPWSTPTPEHIKTLYTPLRGEDIALARPYVTAETTMALGVIRERRRAAELATMGVDYPYSYPGDHFQAVAFN